MIGVLVGQRGNDLNAAVVLLQKIEETRDRRDGHFGVKALFVAHGSVGTMRQTDGGFADGSCVKGRGLQRQGGGILDDLGIETAHDTGDRHRGVVVADHEGVLVDLSVNAVKGFEHKGLIEALDTDLADLARIEGVHGLSHFEHEVVSEVGKEIDASQAAVEQADAHVDRADGALDVLDLQAGIALAQRILDLHVDLLQLVVGFQIGGIQRLERSAGQCGKLARDTVMTPEIGAVGEGLVVDLKDDVVDLVDILQIGAVGNVVGDLHDAGVVVADADLRFGAAHAVGHEAGKRSGRDLDLADLGADLGKGGFHADAHVGSAADNVGQLRFTGVHLQKMELFGIGMRLDGLDLGDDDAADIGTLEEDLVLDLGGRERKFVNIVYLVQTGEIHVV